MRRCAVVRTVVVAALLLSAPLGVIGGVSPAAAAQGGPVVLTGIDAEDCGPGGHGPIGNYATLVASILGNTSNGGNGILVIGANGFGPQAFWKGIESGTGETVTFGNENSSFSGYQMLGIVGSAPQTCSGLTQAQNNVLASRQQDFADFINGGGGLLGNTQSDFVNQYAYLGGVGGFASTSTQYSNIDPTPAGTAVGITDALDVCCWHNVFTAFPSFLEVLAYRWGTTQAAAIGGRQVVVRVGIDLSPASAENPVGTTHEVTASVVDSDGVPQSQVAVQFRVVSGPNAGEQSDPGECTVQPDCTTDANGQVSWSYQSNGQTGTDAIDACFSNPRTQQPSCARATKTWTAPLLAITDAAPVQEGHDGTTPASFTATLTPAVPVFVTVHYATQDGTAAAAESDYSPESDVLVFAPGQTSANVDVDVLGDRVDEPDETFSVVLSGATNAVIADDEGLATIVDDDRDGGFACRASALRLDSDIPETPTLELEPSVANPDKVRCEDDESAVPSSSGEIVTAKVLHAMTDQTPDDLDTPPAAGDKAFAKASLDEVKILAGSNVIEATGVVSQAWAECVQDESGALVPSLATSFRLTSLKVNGVSVLVNGRATVQVGEYVLTVNETTEADTTARQRGLTLSGPDIPEVVVAEATAGYSGNPCQV